MPSTSDSIETEIIEVLANLFRGAEAVGGKLKVTTKRLIFSSHSFNFQRGITEILMKDIESFKFANSLFVIPNKLIIKLKNRTEYAFVLNNRAVIAKLISDYHNGVY